MLRSLTPILAVASLAGVVVAGDAFTAGPGGYTSYSKYANAKGTGGSYTQSTQSSADACAMACNAKAGCQFFDYVASTSACYVHTDAPFGLFSTASASGWGHYARGTCAGNTLAAVLTLSGFGCTDFLAQPATLPGGAGSFASCPDGSPFGNVNVSTYPGYTAPAGNSVAVTGSVYSALDCAARCAVTPGCTSYDYQNSDSLCAVRSSSSPLVASSSAIHGAMGLCSANAGSTGGAACSQVTIPCGSCSIASCVAPINGVSVCTSNQCDFTCKSGFTKSGNLCIDSTSDVNNCGGVGTKCTFTNGSGVCSASTCTYQTCNSGYKLSGNSCVAVDTTSDVNNCGGVGTKCTFTNGSGTCSASKCVYTSCDPNYNLVAGSCTAIDTTSDPLNCGAVGTKCTFTNGAGTCTASKCTYTACNTNYKLSGNTCALIDTTSDPLNCGAVGTPCTFANGSGACQNSKCTYLSCTSGYNLVSNACTAIDTTSDVNNCGALGTKCTFTNGAGSCLNSKCTFASCNSGFSLANNACTAIDTMNDVNNCGAIGTKCAFPLGTGACLASKCAYLSCKSGYTLSAGVCTAIDTTSDPLNCGGVGTICGFTNGAGTCKASKCTFTSCNTGFNLVSNACTAINTLSDASNCGAIGNSCPATYNNGGTGVCIAGSCQTTCNSGYAWDMTYKFCRDVRSDLNNCGQISNVCSLTGASSQVCQNGNCLASACTATYQLLNGVCVNIDVTNNPQNCGSIGKVCSFTPLGATGSCVNSKCVATSCPPGYTVQSGACVKSTASQRARAKKSAIEKPVSLCPTGETACPIAGSASYDKALNLHFTSDVKGMLATSGGYECLDTTQALDSCGGCASTGEGVDCSKIRGAVGVGCQTGQCIVFSCQAGWRPDISGRKCVRVHKSEIDVNSTASSHAKARRHHHHARGSRLGHQQHS